MKKHIPNAITLLNLFCGILAIFLLFEGDVILAGFFVALGIFFDFFDGFFARLLNVKSELGLQLDSLADMVTSGVVPGFAMFFLLLDSNLVRNTDVLIFSYLPFLGFAITLASAYRLANFNIDTRQTTGFIGLPTPANALFIISLLIIQQHQYSFFDILGNSWFLLAITILSSYMLNAEIPLFALKFKDYSFKNNIEKYIFLILSGVSLLIFHILAVPFIILFYILFSIFLNKTKKSLK